MTMNDARLAELREKYKNRRLLEELAWGTYADHSGYTTKQSGEFLNWLCNMAYRAVKGQRNAWIPVSERLPTKEEYKANNGLFIVSDGNRTYAEYFDVYNSMKYFGEPTMNGFRVDRCVVAWTPLPEPYKAERELQNEAN